MAVQTDNTTAGRHWRVTNGEWREKMDTARDKNRHFESITLTTLADGHAVPSKIAATPAASTKAAKLMDTLSDGFDRCYVLLRMDRRSRASAQIDGHARPSIFFATPLPSTKVEKLMGTLSKVSRQKRRSPKVIL